MSGEMGTGGMEQDGVRDADWSELKMHQGHSCRQGSMPGPNWRKCCDYWPAAALQRQFARHLSVRCISFVLTQIEAAARLAA
jgi:hypothetical protein